MHFRNPNHSLMLLDFLKYKSTIYLKNFLIHKSALPLNLYLPALDPNLYLPALSYNFITSPWPEF